MKNQQPHGNATREERISILAYKIWEEEGRPQGRADAHWIKACAIIDAEKDNLPPVPAWLNKHENRPQLHQLQKKSAA